MSLERDIRQSKFKNEFEKVTLNILFTNSWINAFQLKWLKPFGISPQQYNVLRILRGNYPNSYKLAEITDRMIDKNSNATRLVEKLRSKNLLIRTINPENRRQVEIIITLHGLELLERIDKDENWFLANFESISEKEAETLNQLLEKFRS
ncbi:MAG: MarR family transcriptional regulator [Saprospiraceae bacterium]|nr:MarR family transcriptional regulator [Saprospiraceae bacterium]